MFAEIYDRISFLLSRRWPVANGEITLVDVEQTKNHEYRLSVAYKFSLGDDGPYTGEGFWTPAISWHGLQKVERAQAALQIGQRIEVRYRPDDPSVNKVNGGVRRLVQTIPS